MTWVLCDSRNRQNVSYPMSHIVNVGHTPLKPATEAYKVEHQDRQPEATRYSRPCEQLIATAFHGMWPRRTGQAAMPCWERCWHNHQPALCCEANPCHKHGITNENIQSDQRIGKLQVSSIESKRVWAQYRLVSRAGATKELHITKSYKPRPGWACRR